MTYYQPNILVNGEWVFPENVLYSFQVFNSVDDCEKFMEKNGYSVCELNIIEYHNNDIEYPTFLDADGNVILQEFKVCDIDWDVDDPTELEDLPTEVVIEAEDEDEIADALSDEYGYCVNSFSIA